MVSIFFMCIHPTNIFQVPTVYQALVLGAGDTAVNKTEKNACLHGAGMEVGKTDDKETYD